VATTLFPGIRVDALQAQSMAMKE
ncbi:MAG: hypothetical protein ACK4SN_06575, partial [Bellilinea sp.]